jgi:valyl-tRNA synthetase
MHLKDFKGKPKKLEAIDRWILTKLTDIVKDSTDYFDRYEYSKTKADVENFFWNVFCDYYLEIVKDRLYNPDKRGAESRKAVQFTLYTVLLDILKLMAPIMPYITEEIYSVYFAGREKPKSIHVSQWPAARKELVDRNAEKAGDAAAAIISDVRKFKAGKNMSLKQEIKLVIKSKDRKLLEPVLDDLKATVHAKEISFGEESKIEI